MRPSNIKTKEGITLLASIVPQDGEESDVYYDIRRTVLDSSVVIKGTEIPLRDFIDLSVESGNHYSDPVGPDGIFVWKGPNIQKNKDIKINYVDILPNILYALGMPIPEDMDGKFRPEIFVDAKQPSYIETYESESQTILGLLTQGVEANDRASYEGDHLRILSRISEDDVFDQFCFRPADPDRLVVRVDSAGHSSDPNVFDGEIFEANPLLTETLPIFRALPFKELPERHITRISFSDLKFQTIDKEKYAFIFPVGETELPSLGIWTNIFFGTSLDRGGDLYILAQGVPAKGVFPKLTIEQGGKTTVLDINSETAKQYKVPVLLGNIRFSYNNDSLETGEDRNLIIRDIFVAHQPIEQATDLPLFFSEEDNLCVVNSVPGTTELIVKLIPPGHNNPTQIEAQDEAIRLLNEIGEL